MLNVRIEDSFELLSQDEWDLYLGVSLFDSMIIDQSIFGVSSESIPSAIAEMIEQHNNKVGSLRITYALVRHYFDKGIPDDPWSISPGKEGQSIQYFPLFEQEHWMRRFWFNYFAEAFYLKISSVWDSVIEILNYSYSLNYLNDFDLKFKVMKWLKKNKTDIALIFEEILKDKLFEDAQLYRNLAAHGTFAASVTNTIERSENEWVDFPLMDDNGKICLDENNKPITKRVKATVITMRAGDYTNVSTIMTNMEDYSSYTGHKIQEIISKV